MLKSSLNFNGQKSVNRYLIGRFSLSNNDFNQMVFDSLYFTRKRLKTIFRQYFTFFLHSLRFQKNVLSHRKLGSRTIDRGEIFSAVRVFIQNWDLLIKIKSHILNHRRHIYSFGKIKKTFVLTLFIYFFFKVSYNFVSVKTNLFL